MESYKFKKYTIDADIPKEDVASFIEIIESLDKKATRYTWRGLILKTNPSMEEIAKNEGLDYFKIQGDFLKNFDQMENIEAFKELYKRNDCIEDFEKDLHSSKFNLYISNLINIEMQNRIYEICMEKESEKENEL